MAAVEDRIIPGFEGMPELDLPDYWIDQYEVTNRQFKALDRKSVV